MHIALDARRIAPAMFGGVGQYVVRIVRGLVARGHQVTVLFPHDRLPDVIADLLVHKVYVLGDYGIGLARYRTDFWGLARALRSVQADVFHATDSMGLSRGVMPTVLTLHDLIPWHTGEYLNWWTLRLYKHMVRSSVASATEVICISEYTRQQAINILHADQKKMRVVYHGLTVAPATGAEPLAAPNKFLLYVGGLGPRKNIPRLFAAYAKLRQRLPDAPVLVMVGHEKTIIKPLLERTVRELNIQQHVRFMGFVSDAQVAWLRARAVCGIYVSENEGFGLPILEGMTEGLPMLVAKATALPEIAGDAAVLVDPYNVNEIADGLFRLTTDAALREKLKSAGKIRAAQFTWERTLDQTIATYQQASGR